MSRSFDKEDEEKLSVILAKAGLVHLKDVFVREKVKIDG